ncbi:hypothetical protein NO263_11645 [Gluconacetobacter entanii]|uniref:Uncharacterized protein n=1 Tax=Gluconacetobacter entanii TaxID=108528 RepID=A0ABT3K786_9PROT|nr:hypothetical protein [Gluconacetobacter entanii]MCW4591234.1 hypothetical protein [Gluconacetobacter entanii]MCW4595476.1 hypothetical protein [Gluconacetobacter entanii]NPC88558.1 hypothetical protein [Gluconacetobacter entanii]
MPLKSRHRPSGTSASPHSLPRPATPDRLRPARGLVVGIVLGIACWGVLIAGFCLMR